MSSGWDGGRGGDCIGGDCVVCPWPSGIPKPVDYLAFEEIEDIAAILNSVAAAVNLYCRNRILKIISEQLAAAKIDDVIDLDEKGNVQMKGGQP